MGIMRKENGNYYLRFRAWDLGFRFKAFALGSRG